MKNNNDVRMMLKEAGILFVITLLSGLILGFVYELTKEPRRVQQELAVVKACQAVFSDASEFEELEYALPQEQVSDLAAKGVEIGTIFCARDNAGAALGYVVETSSREGYGGSIVLYVGVRMDGTLNDVSILEISETPGLGMKAEEVLIPQLRKKQVASFTYTKSGSQSISEIDAISGATITTAAVTNAVNGGLEIAADLIEGGADNE